MRKKDFKVGEVVKVLCNIIEVSIIGDTTYYKVVPIEHAKKLAPGKVIVTAKSLVNGRTME